MSEHQDARDMLDRAERAAEAGDLAAAEELLRSAARSQEEELGPLHPDLANTLNNLAIVAERTGRPDEAEAFYRRAVAIASASLPSEHPMVVASRQNLEDFCRSRGLPIDIPADEDIVAAGAPAATETGAGAVIEEAAPPSSAAAPLPAASPSPAAPLPAAPPPAARPPAVPPAAAPPAAPRQSAPPSAPREPTPPPRQPLPAAPTSGQNSYPVAWTAIGALVLVAAVLLVWRPWSSREAPTPAPVAVSPPPDAPAARPAPIEPAGPPKAAPRRDDRIAATNKPPAPAPAPGDITVATQLCVTFTMSGESWRCEAAGDSVVPGRLVLYTRVKSPRSAVVVHRWYRGDTLRQSVRLAVQANPAEGYRTFSRQTVNAGDWRVEVRSADGSLLHEQRFSVR